MAYEEYNSMHDKLFGKTQGWVDDYYESQLKEMEKEIMVSRENRKILEDWKAKYDAGAKR